VSRVLQDYYLLLLFFAHGGKLRPHTRQSSVVRRQTHKEKAIITFFDMMVTSPGVPVGQQNY